MKETYTVITGASSGIGRATAVAFAKRRKNLVLVARRRELLVKLKKELLKSHPTIAIIIKSYDLSVTSNCYRLYDELKPFTLETWINNAGLGDFEQLTHVDLAKIDSLLQVNVIAVTLLSTLYTQDYCSVAGSQLINVSSASSFLSFPEGITYCA